jgi:hypothetical protein
MTLDQRCTNHEMREAVCRCPLCRRSFCRECVTEHEDRLVCAACLRAAARTAGAPRTTRRRAAEIAMTLGGVLLAWAIFLGAAESVITITERSERMEWQAR